jgi:tetratricopeptide (TPR) repeat protein
MSSHKSDSLDQFFVTLGWLVALIGVGLSILWVLPKLSISDDRAVNAYIEERAEAKRVKQDFDSHNQVVRRKPIGSSDGIEPDDIEAQSKAARQALEQGQIEVARDLWLRVVAQDPRNVPALTELAYISLENLQDHASAMHYFRAALTVDPNREDILRELSNLAQLSDGVDENINFMRELIEQYPDAGYVKHQLGLVLLQRNEFAEASANFESAMVSSSSPEASAELLARSLSGMGQHKLAAEAFADAAALERQRAAALAKEGIATPSLESNLVDLTLDQIEQLLYSGQQGEARGLLAEIEAKLDRADPRYRAIRAELMTADNVHDRSL